MIAAQDLMIGDWVYRVDFKEPIPVRILGLEVVNYDTHPKQLELQIKYVHELQHALRLAGIDKEITI